MGKDSSRMISQQQAIAILNAQHEVELKDYRRRAKIAAVILFLAGYFFAGVALHLMAIGHPGVCFK